MTPSDDLSPPRRPIFFPVVIATVFLTIIAMTGGFVLGERHRNKVTAEPGPTAVTTSPATVESSQPDGKPCPEETRATARRVGVSDALRQVMRIRTDAGTVVWICADPDGVLYYQGKTGGPDAPLVEGQNGLFLTDVEQTGPGHYQATDGKGNLFMVSRDIFEVRFASGKRQSDPVIADE